MVWTSDLNFGEGTILCGYLVPFYSKLQISSQFVLFLSMRFLDILSAPLIIDMHALLVFCKTASIFK